MKDVKFVSKMIQHYAYLVIHGISLRPEMKHAIFAHRKYKIARNVVILLFAPNVLQAISLIQVTNVVYAQTNFTDVEFVLYLDVMIVKEIIF